MDMFESMRAFVRVVEAGSFSKAAATLSVTTAQVSRAVSGLETRLRTRLLQRTSRQMSLTEAGERYLQRCEEILALIGIAEAEAAGAAALPSGRLRIHATISFGQHYLAPLIADYQKMFPDVSIELILGQRTPDMIEEGFDISVAVARQLRDSALVSQHLGAAYTILCASPHYLAAHGMPASIEALNEHNCIQLLLGDMPPGQWIFDDSGKTVFRHKRSTAFTVNIAEAMVQALCKGVGIGPVPVRIAIPYLRSGSLVRVLPGHRLLPNNVYALYPSRQYVDAKVRSFVEFLRQNAALELDRDEKELRELCALSTDRQE